MPRLGNAIATPFPVSNSVCPGGAVRLSRSTAVSVPRLHPFIPPAKKKPRVLAEGWGWLPRRKGGILAGDGHSERPVQNGEPLRSSRSQYRRFFPMATGRGGPGVTQVRPLADAQRWV